MSRRVSAARLAKKRANWRANRRSVLLKPFKLEIENCLEPEMEKIEKFPAFYYDPGFIGCVGLGHDSIPHLMVPFSMERYEKCAHEYLELRLREIAREFNLRDYRWYGLAGCIHQMVTKGVDHSLIQRCILADHLNVWKDFNVFLISTGEWDEAAAQLNKLIKSV